MTRKRVLLLGASGTIGRATLAELLRRGNDVVCFLRAPATLPPGATLRFGDITDPASLPRDGIKGERFDALISCLASRTGASQDAWAIDHQAQMHALAAAQAAQIPHFVLLSAICVQKPVLEFQKAKLAFEAALQASDLRWTIVRPTAFFKSLSGQFDRLRTGKPFLLFGDGALTACKPISDADLAAFLVDCLTDPTRWNRILPIGGPGPALTPRQQGEALFAALGQTPKYRQVSIALMDAIISVLATLGRISPRIWAKADLARIGRYYATESMLVWDADAGQYDANATPETGTETLPDFYRKLAQGEATVERGDHAVF